MMSSLPDGESQWGKGVPVSKGHFSVVSIMFIIFTSRGSQDRKCDFISVRAVAWVQDSGDVCSGWERTMLKVLPEAME